MSDERAWVETIACPRQKALAQAIPALAGLVGLTAEEMAEGRRTANTDRDSRINTMRVLVLGAVIALGRDLGIRRSDLYGLCGGTTQIKDLVSYHRYSVLRAERRFLEFLDQGGVLGQDLKAAVGPIAHEAMKRVRVTS